MNSLKQKVSIRPSTPEDATFIEQMAYEASFPDWMDERPSLEEAQKIEWFPHYSENWGQLNGDYGLIAEDEAGTSVGAAWYRDFSSFGPEEGVPTSELCIALVPEARGRKLGEELMSKLLSDASDNGVDEIGLVVRSNNERAVNLYRKLGFLTAKESDTGYTTMIVSTSSSTEK
jgi:ribosomal protein S18 acetylase RimI-like enzyme